MSGKGRVAVVGAGIVGLCVADELLSRGFQVTVVERELKPGSGCSYGNGGLIVPSHFEPLAAPGMIAMGLRMLPNPESPFAIHGVTDLEVLSWVAKFMRAANHDHVTRCAPVLRDLNLESRSIYGSTYKSLAEGAGFEDGGELMICKTVAALDGEMRLAERAQKLGLKTRSLTQSELRAEEPHCDIDAAGAVYFRDDGKVSPRQFMDGLRQRVIEQGATILDGVSVTGFNREGSKLRSLTTTGEEIEADQFVLAAGAWTTQLAAKLGLKVPMLGGKGYGFTVTNPPQSPRLPALLIEGRLAVTPMIDGLRFVGTMELGKPSSHAVNANRVNGMRKSIAEYYPAFRGFDLSGVDVWCGLRPCSPDGMPYLGRTARYQNLCFATGHGMMGMSLGPISGRLVAQVAAGETPSLPLDLMSPDRYA